MKFLNNFFVTWFWCGKIPYAPGTAGSIGALPLCWFLALHYDLTARIAFAILFTVLACFFAMQDQKSSSVKDPGYIVIDEVAGMLWSTLLLTATKNSFLWAFILFRIFDVIKPLPANLFDRYSKTAQSPLQRGIAIVFDDVIAGLYVALLLYGVKFFEII